MAAVAADVDAGGGGGNVGTGGCGTVTVGGVAIVESTTTLCDGTISSTTSSNALVVLPTTPSTALLPDGVFELCVGE